MEQQGFGPDLVPAIGHRGRVGECWRKAAVTLAMIQKLHEALGIRPTS
jgi:antitoxin component HigA of HigAB toxin-antitoxin module